MTTPISGSNQPGAAAPQPARKADPPAAASPAEGVAAAHPPQQEASPEVKQLLKDPLLGEPFSLLRQGAHSSRVLLPLGTVLVNAPLDSLKAAYYTARQALTELMYDPKSDPQLRAHVGDMVTAAMGALQHRGVDPLAAPEPSEVKFPSQ